MPAKKRNRQARAPKPEVTEVFVLEKWAAYDGSYLLGAFYTREEAMQNASHTELGLPRPVWDSTGNNVWTMASKPQGGAAYSDEGFNVTRVRIGQLYNGFQF